MLKSMGCSTLDSIIILLMYFDVIDCKMQICMLTQSRININES